MFLQILRRGCLHISDQMRAGLRIRIDAAAHALHADARHRIQLIAQRVVICGRDRLHRHEHARLHPAGRHRAFHRLFRNVQRRGERRVGALIRRTGSQADLIHRAVLCQRRAIAVEDRSACALRRLHADTVFVAELREDERAVPVDLIAALLAHHHGRVVKFHRACRGLHFLMIADIRAGIGRLRLDVAEFDGRSTDAAIDVLITRDERLLAPGCAGVLAEMRIHLLIVLFLQQRSKCLQLLLRRRPRRHEHRDAGDDCDHGSRRDDRDASRLFVSHFRFPFQLFDFLYFTMFPLPAQ